MKVSDRIERYLDTRYTLWTWIKYNERSHDPEHCTRIKREMRRVLGLMMQQGKVTACKSIKGKIAFKRREIQ